MDPETTTEAVSAATGQATDAVAAATAAAAAGPTLWSTLAYVIMVPMVYAALLALVAGLAVRVIKLLRSPAPPASLRLHPARKHPVAAALGETFAMPQIRKRKPVFWLFVMIYHVGFLLLILGHLDILPSINLLPSESRHMIGAGAVGIMVTLPAVVFLVRRLRSPLREISVPADFLLLLLLLALFLLGDMMSWSNSWNPAGFVMTKEHFSQYFGILAGFTFADPRTVLHGSHYHFVVLHVLLANLLFVILPHTKVVHSFLALPVNLIRRR